MPPWVASPMNAYRHLFIPGSRAATRRGGSRRTLLNCPIYSG